MDHPRPRLGSPGPLSKRPRIYPDTAVPPGVPPRHPNVSRWPSGPTDTAAAPFGTGRTHTPQEEDVEEDDDYGPVHNSGRGAEAAGVPSRVVLHLDLDCFYCQVEQLRLKIPTGTPCAVQQWEGLIAVNYEARAKGVTRHMRAADARKACPDIRLVHVQTIGDGAGTSEDTAGGGAGPPEDDRKSSRTREKACLERYRQASLKILGLIRSTMGDRAVIEKASIDEVYIDITDIVNEELRNSCQNNGQSLSSSGPQDSNFFWGSIVKGDRTPGASSCLDARFAVGASVCARLRGLVRSNLGYTLSGGIASNKLLAKLASAMHKPNQQTVILPRAVEELMADLPLTKIGRLGGKLGAEVQEMGCSTAGEVARLSLQHLQKHIGEQRGQWVYNAVRGLCNEPVVTKGPPKSMLAAKSFNSTADMPTIERWLQILADELAGRMQLDEETHQRRAKNLVLHWRGGSNAGSNWGRERSRSCALLPGTFGPGGIVRPPLLVKASLAMLVKADDAIPCSRLALSTTEFSEAPASSAASITRFFKAAAAGETVGHVASGSRAAAAPGDNKSSSPTMQQQGQAKPSGMAAFLQRAPVSLPAPTVCSQSPDVSPSRQLLWPSQGLVGATAFPKWSEGFRLHRVTTSRPSPESVAMASETSPGRSDAQFGAGPQRNGTPSHQSFAGSLRLPSQGGSAPADSSVNGGDVNMADVDLDEQKRILRDIEMMRRRIDSSCKAQGGLRAVAKRKGSRGAPSDLQAGEKPKKSRTGHEASSEDGAGPQQRSIVSMFSAVARGSDKQ